MMTLKRRRAFITLCAVLGVGLFGFGNVAAQEGASPMSAAPADEFGHLSPQEKMNKVNADIESVKAIYRRVQNMLDNARREKDTIRITCLDDKLTQIHVNLRGVEERQSAMAAAVNTGDTATVDQQFTILGIYTSRINSLNVEADNCVGDSDVVLGESETTVTIDDDIIVEDPTVGDNQLNTIHSVDVEAPVEEGTREVIDRLGPVSPYR